MSDAKRFRANHAESMYYKSLVSNPPPVKVIDGDDGSERDDPSLVISGQPDYNDDQMWAPTSDTVPEAPIVREHNLEDQTLIAIKLGDGDSRLISPDECDRLRDELIALRGLPSHELVWTHEPPEGDCWWVRSNDLPIALKYEDGRYIGIRSRYRASLVAYGKQGDLFAVIPGGIPRGPTS